MKKRYLFVAAAILAAGLIFSGCDLFDNGSLGGGGGETYEDLTITGQAVDGKSVTTIFSTTRSPGKAAMPKPETGDTYKILHDNIEVSRGGIEMLGSIVTFKPSSGGSSFEAILGTSNNNYVLNFPYGINTSNGNNIEYVNNSVVIPEFDTDLASNVALSIGQTATLTVAVKTNSSGGTVSYQWYKAESINDTGTPITGATSASYTVSGTAPNTVFYYVRVTNASGGVKKSNVAKVVVGSNSTDLVVGGSTGVKVEDLPAIITYMLAGNTSLDYTVTFVDALDKPLFVSAKTFPGTGKLTIKATVPLSTGIHITRSNVVLDGLRILITDYTKVPKVSNSDFCAILVSKQYMAGASKGYYLPMDPDDQEGTDSPENWSEYNRFSTINNVEIVDCNVSFVASSATGNIHAIYVDPLTAGRTSSNRVKIKNTVVNTSGNTGNYAFCFFGNHADLSGNVFTSTSTFGVLAVDCIFDLIYGGSDATIYFAGNQFNASKGGGLAMVIANSWTTIDQSDKLKPIRDDDFDPADADLYKTLPPQYQKVIRDLFAQASSTDDRSVRLMDCSDGNVEYYIKKGNDYEGSSNN